jgi:hypothetical protein
LKFLGTKAHANATIVGAAPEGAVAKIVAKKGGWYQVEVNAIKGWTSSNNLLVSSPLACQTWK